MLLAASSQGLELIEVLTVAEVRIAKKAAATVVLASNILKDGQIKVDT